MAMSILLSVYGIFRLLYAQKVNYKKWDIERTLLSTTIVSSFGTAMMYFTHLGFLAESSTLVKITFILTEMLITFSFIICLFRLVITIGALIGWEKAYAGLT